MTAAEDDGYGSATTDPGDEAAYLDDVANHPPEPEPEPVRDLRPRLAVVPTGDGDPDEQSEAAEPAPDLPNLPDEFWAARPEFEHIRAAAHSRACSADLVLWAVLARLSGMLDPALQFDVGRGPGSLNLFVAGVGSSGIGKTTGARLARELIHAPPQLTRPCEDGRPLFHDGLPLGSGEGMAEAFMGTVQQETGELDRRGQPKTVRVRAQVRHNAFFAVDEGEALTRGSERTGATVGPTIRSAWVGELLGQANSSEDRIRVIPAGTYSMGMLIGFQPDTAAPLLSDAGPGTPQRFLWCSAHDRSVPACRVEHPGPLQVTLTDGWGEPWASVMPSTESIRAEVWARQVAIAHGELQVEPLDAHEPLLRAKVAGLLALLAGRGDITEEDWELSAQAWETSCAVRDGLLEIGVSARRREREQRVRDDVEKQLRVETAVNNLPAAIKRIAEHLGRRADEDGALTNGAAWKSLSGRDRKHGRDLFEAALDYGSVEGLFVRGRDGITSVQQARR